jgi:hypothetical protein
LRASFSVGITTVTRGQPPAIRLRVRTGDDESD